MRTRMVLLLACALLAPAVSAGYESFPPPKEAKAWLGHWKTNQGTFAFGSITTCYRGADIVGGASCGVTGTWDQPGSAGTVPIHGTIFLGPKYQGEAFQGCYDLPNLIPPNHCTFNSGGQISLDRSGERMTHGYWKACGLGESCKSHHPITGKKVSSGGGSGCKARAAGCSEPEAVRWSVTVDGFPDRPDEKDLPNDLAGVEIQSKGTTLERDGGGFKPHGKLDMTLTYVDPVATPHVQEEQYTLRIREFLGYVDQPDVRRVSVIAVVSTSSKRDDCPDGVLVNVRLTITKDKRALAFDGVNGRRNGCLSDHTVVWGPNRIKKASISKPTPA